MILPTGPKPNSKRNSQRGFTLIELIIVMVLLTTVLAVAAPALSKFFKGRVLKDETRRFMALLKHGRNEAISDGVPMVFWVDVNFKRFGLSPRESYEDHGSRTFEFQLNEALEIIADPNDLSNPNVGRIEFLPDGSIVEGSLYEVIFHRKDQPNNQVRIAQSFNGLSYEVRKEEDDVMPFVPRSAQ